MRSYDPNDEEKVKYAKDLNAPQWMLDALMLNPEYVHWGNYEDYMNVKTSGWNQAKEVDSFKELPVLDEINECVHFYFNIEREGHNCPNCSGTGMSKQMKQLSDNFCNIDNLEQSWFKKLNQQEVDFLIEKGCFKRFFDTKELGYKLTAEEVNHYNNGRKLVDGDLSVVGNLAQYYLIENRAKVMGYEEKCSNCQGAQVIYTKDLPNLQLQIWLILPRKGASRGILLKDIQQHEFKDVLKWLKIAAERNQMRFSKIISEYEKLL